VTRASPERRTYTVTSSKKRLPAVPGDAAGQRSLTAGAAPHREPGSSQALAQDALRSLVRQPRTARGPGGRPRSEVRDALLRAARELASSTSFPCLRELASHARVGLPAARRALDNMRRAGELVIVRARKVSWRNRPIPEWAPPDLAPAPTSAATDHGLGLQVVLSGWCR
jgi:hypothetical protein